MNEENRNVRLKLLKDREEHLINTVREMVKEVQEYNKKKEKEKEQKCTFTLVIPYPKMKYKGVEHSGVITHVCQLKKGHEGSCNCCNGLITWIGWTK